MTQLPYGVYDISTSPTDYQYPLYLRVDYSSNFDEANFAYQQSEISDARLFAANITIPSASSLNQASALSSRRLVLPDLASNSSPSNYLWRLVPLIYFGGGCDTLDVSMVDFYNQLNFCSSSYGTLNEYTSVLTLLGSCMNYQLSYWMKDTVTSTLPAVVNNFGRLYGTVDGTKVCLTTSYESL